MTAQFQDPPPRDYGPRQSEIDYLRAELARYQIRSWAASDSVFNENVRLAIDNAKLRAALERIADENWSPKLTAIARAAIEETK